VHGGCSFEARRSHDNEHDHAALGGTLTLRRDLPVHESAARYHATVSRIALA
jgi:hypothetical protein